MREGVLMQEVGRPVGPGVSRVLSRIGRCALTYLVLYTVAWVAIALGSPPEDSLAVIVRDSLTVAVVTGVPSLLLGIIAGLTHTQMDVIQFRLIVSVPMAVFAWPLMAASGDEPLLYQVIAQVAFVWLTPAPLIPENWEGPALQSKEH